MSPMEQGFANLAAAQASLRLVGRRMALREGLKRGQTSLAALLHMLDQRADALRNRGLALCECGIGLTGGDQEGAVDQLSVLSVEGREQAEQELLEGVDLVLQLLDRIDSGMRHGLFSLRHAGEAIPAAELRHRLRETGI